MLIGYMRVSKNDGSQTLDLQKDALIASGVDEERIYHDYLSSKKESRPGLEACFKALQPGNTLLVWKLDRLGRSLKELVTMIDELRQRKIGFKVLAGHGAQIDTTTPNGRLVFGLFATLAEFERELIVERTNAGLAAARARGRMGGRPRKVDTATLKMAAAAMSDPKSIASEVAKRLNITTATLYTYVNSDGSLKPAGIKLAEIGVKN
jgi:DNA invertase Pin-like site-specific DNA recombinase